MTSGQIWFLIAYSLALFVVLVVYPKIVEWRIRKGGPGW